MALATKYIIQTGSSLMSADPAYTVLGILSFIDVLKHTSPKTFVLFKLSNLCNSAGCGKVQAK